MTSIYHDRNYLRQLPDSKLIEKAREGDNDLARVLAERLAETNAGYDGKED